MNRWFRSISAMLSALVLAGALHAAPPPPGGGMDQLRNPLRQRPLPEPPPLPQYTLTAPCTTGPAPELRTELIAVYFHVGWAKVPGATQYVIARYTPVEKRPVVITPAGFNPAPSPYLLEYWDHPSEARVPNQYTVTAIQADGCTGSATVTVGPFTAPNPPTLSATRVTATSAKLVWPQMRGATFYRVDGPGIANTGVYLKAETYTPGQMPMLIAPLDVGSAGQNLTKTFAVGLAGGEFHVTAIYPDTADYSTPARAIVPALAQCGISHISPTSGTSTTPITITGHDFNFASNLWFVAPNKDYGMPFTVNSPTTITATTLVSGVVKVQTPAGVCVSSQRFELAGQSAPPADVLVPGVVGLSFTGAVQVLQRAGFNPVGVSGPAGPLAIVQTQQPQGGARAQPGSTVSLTTVAVATGFSEITLYNNMQYQHSLNVWLFDQATGTWSGGDSVGYGSTTTLTLTSGHQHFVLAVDPSKCGGQNDHNNPACEYWRLPGVPGDSNGPTTTVGIN